MNEDAVRDLLQEVEDPDLDDDIVSLNLVNGIELEGESVHVSLALGAPYSPTETAIADEVRQVLGDAGLEVELSAHVDDGISADEQVFPNVENVIAVASGKGGVGKSTVAVNLAAGLADMGARVGLFDADIYGPNVPHVLNDVEGPVLTNENGQPVPLESDGIQTLSPGVVGGEAPTARRGSIAYGAVENLLGQGAWDDRDVMVIDMPAGTDDVLGAALEHVPVDGVVLVTTPFDASVDDTRRTLELFQENGVSPIAGVVNMSGFDCQCCGERNHLFEGEVDLDVPALHRLPFDRDLQRNPDAEDGHEALSALADTVGTYVEDVLEEVPDDAVDARELPPNSQITQLCDELAYTDPGSRVAVAVGDPEWVREEVREATDGLVGEIVRTDLAATGALLEVERR